MVYIAHKNVNNKIQTVKEHSENVANYAFDEAKSIGLSSTMKLVGLLHDMGKNKEEFQLYLDESIKNKDNSLRGSVNHTTAGARYFYEIIKKNNLYNDINDLLLVELVCYAIMTHHGIIDCIDTNACDKYTQKLYSNKENAINEIIHNSNNYISERLILELYSEAKNEINSIYNKIKYTVKEMQKSTNSKFENNPTHFMLGALQRLLCSLLINADRKDTYEFMNNIKEEYTNEKDRACLWNNYQIKLENRLKLYNNNNDINNYRKKISDECLNFAKNTTDGIYRLDVPTGGGKTISSMRLALEFAKRNNKKHIYYVAPFISILEQNANVYKNIFDDEDNILEHHSNVIICNKNYDELEKYELLQDNWTSPIILTTMVRFLEVLFDSSNSNIRRFNQLKDSIIILDEAQQIPIKCVYMFNTMINFLNNVCNSTIIFCTATQPLFDVVKYPLLYSDNCEVVKDNIKTNDVFKRNAIVYDRNTESGKYNKIELARLIIDKISSLNSILIILNTKSAVLDLYKYIKCNYDCDINIVQLTTYMCPEHRINIINNLKEQLKDITKRKIICITTQLIESGVDISFDMVVRSLTGIDGIMQAAGRCNRNKEKDIGEVKIIDYQDENTNSLKDIERAKNASNAIMLNNCNMIEVTLDKIDKYYKQYFFDRENEMKYNIENNDNLYELLSDNREYNREYIRLNGDVDVEYPLRQAYKIAGDQFKVIDNNMVSIIVKYENAEKLINDYKHSYSITDKKLVLKKLQRYTVSLYKNDKLLNDVIGRNGISYIDKDENIMVLDSNYYDDNGITSELQTICI